MNLPAAHAVKYVTFGIAVAVLLLFSTDAFAKVGVGMGAGEIQLDAPVKLGGIYELPNLRIFNTGDETTTYGMDIAYHQDYDELRPAKEWFSFSPETFTLEPNESQEVSVTLTMPLKERPGDYFAFVEGGPVVQNEPGTSVGVAVGTKLFFTVVPANVLQAAVYRASSLTETYAPWSWISLGIIVLLVAVMLFRKFFSFNISMRKQ